jgi:ferritin-like metal-binding protein YciE
MSKLKNVHDLLVHNIKDLYSAENQLVKALPKMAKAANHPDLKEGFLTHLEETKVHAARLEEVGKLLDASPRGVTCKAMKGLVEEGEEAIEEEAEAHIKDLNLIAAAQKAEHYEISGYGTARAMAKYLGLNDVADILKTTEDEEGSTDKTLTKLAFQIMKASPAEK